METQGYGQFIYEQIHDWPIVKPVTTAAIAASVADAFGIGMDSAKKVTNVNMKRLADRGELSRVLKGVYSIVKDTSFGKVTPRPDDILSSILLNDGEGVIGYITGPTLLNRIGLCSLIPGDRHIATNRHRLRMPENTRIRVYKPIMTVNDENAPYLQALEAFMAMEQYPIDTEKPYEALRAMLLNNNIDNEKLILIARHNCGHKTLLQAIDIALGEKLQ